jgi:NADPH-dependent curcumin reductase CurA
MKSAQFIFASRPHGFAETANFKYEEYETEPLKEGEVLLKPAFFSVDPYMRGRMNDTRSYAAGWELGKPVSGGAVAEVLESRSSGLSAGDYVTGYIQWSTFGVEKAEELRKIDVRKYPPEYYLGILGMPGLTAYFGMTDICRPVKGDTVVISGAAGAVGHVAGQIAKIAGARVIGIAGTDEKCRLLKEEFGFEEAVNYKTSKSVRKDIAMLCPNGVNAYFDNVGGEVSDGVIANLAFHSRIALCGQISQYNSTRMPAGNFNMSIFLTRSVLLKGFIVRDYTERFPEGTEQLSRWIDEGRLRYTSTVVEGFEKLPEAFIGLFDGRNTGKMIVKV